MAEPQKTKLIFKNKMAFLTLMRPEKRNAINAAMIDELLEQVRQIELSDALVVILSGCEGSFCSGGDIDDWSAQSPQDFGRHWVRHGHILFDALARIRQPLIAVLNGHALGGGLELAVCADYRIAEQHVKIGQPETGLGIIPGWSGTQRVVRRFGAQTVRKMALFGKIYNAEEALMNGLVDQVVATGEGVSAAKKLASQVKNRAACATEMTKMLINAAEGEEQERVLESMAGFIAAGSVELTEGIQAFQQKRQPRFDK